MGEGVMFRPKAGCGNLHVRFGVMNCEVLIKLSPGYGRC